MNNIDMELTTLESERKMSALALKGHQNKLAEQLRGKMGEDINNTINKKKTFWDRIDNFLRMF